MLKFVSIGAAATAFMGTALGDYAARFVPERADPETLAMAEATPLLQRLALDVPDLARKPAAAAGTMPAAAGVVGGGFAPPPFVAAALTPDDSARALDCLTAAVYHEARSEGVNGERAVAQVVLNRVRDRAFPPSVCGVVYQGSNRATGCQFSFTCDGSLLRPRDPNAWERAREVAVAALGGDVYAPVGSATHYHADYVSPWWAPSLARIGAVGSHIFYRWPGRLERALAFRQAYAGAEPGAPAPALRPAVAATGFAPSPTAGVRVHRFGAEEASVDAPRLVTTAGVRIHRGATGSDDIVRTIDGTTIGAESDPI